RRKAHEAFARQCPDPDRIHTGIDRWAKRALVNKALAGKTDSQVSVPEYEPGSYGPGPSFPKAGPDGLLHAHNEGVHCSPGCTASADRNYDALAAIPSSSAM
ncbi:hypothetical protein AVEN_111044-1, partial [Araneus ventricosus]